LSEEVLKFESSEVIKFTEADMWIDMMTVVRVVQVVLIVLALVVITDAALRK
jgi:hypothetical protein